MKISVIVPTFNRAFCIEKALTSILTQTYKPLEIIVVDDGSTDNTSEIVQSFPIQYLHQKNKGVASARNLAIRKSKGDWIAFLDSDDTWMNQKLERQIQEIKKTKRKLCHTDEVWIRNNHLVNPKKHLLKSNDHLFKRSLKRCCISPSSALIEKKMLLELGLFDESLTIAEDYDLWLKFLVQFKPAFVDQKLVTRYAGHEGQLSNRHSIDRFKIQSLLNLLQNYHLSPIQKELVEQEILVKKKIYTQGQKKRGVFPTPLFQAR